MTARVDDVTLDTSAWINLCELHPDLHDFDHAAWRSWRLVVPVDTLSEIVGQGDAHRSWKLVSALERLRQIAGADRVVVAQGLTELMQYERRHETVRRTPALVANEIDRYWRLFASRDAYLSAHPTTAESLQRYLDKRRAYDVDRNARDGFRERMSESLAGGANWLDHILADFESFCRDHSPFFKIVKNMTPGGVRMFERKARYAATLTWVVAQTLTALGAVRSAIAPGHVSWLEKATKGSWVDNRIAAAAARSRYLVTDDASLRAKSQFSAVLLGLKMDVLTSGDLIDCIKAGHGR